MLRPPSYTPTVPPSLQLPPMQSQHSLVPPHPAPTTYPTPMRPSFVVTPGGPATPSNSTSFDPPALLCTPPQLELPSPWAERFFELTGDPSKHGSWPPRWNKMFKFTWTVAHSNLIFSHGFGTPAHMILATMLEKHCLLVGSCIITKRGATCLISISWSNTTAPLSSLDCAVRWFLPSSSLLVVPRPLLSLSSLSLISSLALWDPNK